MLKITSVLALCSLTVSPAFAAECMEGYLFSTGDEVVRLPEMEAVGSYGTLITRSGDRWVLNNGSVDVSSKGRALDISTSSGSSSSIPANSKASIVESEGGIREAESVKVAPDSQQLQLKATHHDMGNKGKKNKAVQVILQDNSYFSMVAPYRIKWENGTALFNAPRGIVLDTKEGTVKAPPGSIFVLSSSFGGVRVMNCSSLAPISFVLSDKQIVVTASEEVFVCNHRPMQFEVTPNDGVGRKAIKLVDLGNELTAVTSQFSIPTVMRSEKYFKHWTRNGGSRTQLSSDLLKTAAVVSFARKSTAGQQFYIAPRSNTF